MAHKGAGEKTRKIQTRGRAWTRQQLQRAENGGGGDYQRGKSRTVGRSKGEQVSSTRTDDRESNYSVRRMLLAKNRGWQIDSKKESKQGAIGLTL
jgi:hypothetical protein